MRRLACSMAITLLFANFAFGQDASPQPKPLQSDKPKAVQNLESKLQAIESATDNDETAKAKAVEAYKQAINYAASTESLRAQAESFKANTAQIDSLLAAERDKVAAKQQQPSIAPSGLELKELDQNVQRNIVELERLKQALAEATNAIADREKRLQEIPKALANANTKLSEVEAESNKSPPSDQVQVVTEANSALLEQRRVALRDELDALKAENGWLVANDELLGARREIARQQLDRHQAELELWQQAAREKRESDVDRDIREADQALKDLPEPLKPLGEANKESAARRRVTKNDLQTATEDHAKWQDTFNKIDQQYVRAQQEAKAEASVSQAVGEVLRERRIELRNVEQQLPSSKSLASQVSAMRLQMFLLREELSELEDLDTATSAKLTELNVSDEFQEPVRTQLEFRVSLLKGLLTDTEALFGMLAKVEGTATGLKSRAETYAQFIDERVLWIRSADPFGIQQFGEAVGTATELAKSSGWKTLPSLWLARFFQKPFLPTVAIVALLPLVIYSYRLRKAIRACGEKAKSGGCRDFGYTTQATLLTIMLGFVWPAVAYLAGIWLQGGRLVENNLAAQVSAGLLAAGTVLLPLELWRQSARKLGLMEAHFGIAAHVTDIIRRNVRWLAFLVVPLMAAMAMVNATDNPVHERSLGRLLFVFLMLAVAAFLYRVANPKGGVVQGYLARHSDSILYKGRFVWFWMLVICPIGFAIVAIAGYQFTAEQLTTRLFWSSFLLLGLWFLYALAMRWVVLSRRRLAIEQTRARLARASEQAETDLITAEAQANLEEIDLGSVDLQTRRLIRAVTVVVGALAVWSLWVDVLPALSSIGDRKAWDVVAATSPAETSASAASPSAEVITSSDKEVTYGNVFKAAAIFCIMLVAMRDVPGLLELVLLQRLPLDVALRFAITTLTRYVIFVVGLAWALSTIQIGWAKVQWLVAGVSVGLGFGLQEIFANFVSGLIILFERPLRTGDIVTIDGVTGTVKNIRMRATIIQDLDRKDFVVPNKDFITGRLLNWTLSDEVSRIVLPVGIAYGSDTDLAKEIVLSTAQNQEQIVDDPPPQVTFEAFGDSSLNLVLRCFITLQNMPSRLKIIDELHSTIDKRFRNAGIEIPFPQRDLHLRSTDIDPPDILVRSKAKSRRSNE